MNHSGRPGSACTGPFHFHFHFAHYPCSPQSKRNCIRSFADWSAEDRGERGGCSATTITTRCWGGIHHKDRRLCLPASLRWPRWGNHRLPHTHPAWTLCPHKPVETLRRTLGRKTQHHRHRKRLLSVYTRARCRRASPVRAWTTQLWQLTGKKFSKCIKMW